MIKHCEICGIEIPRGLMSTTNKKYQAKKYCGKTCHYKAMRKEYKYNCADCGAEVIRTKEGITNNVFCDDTCKGRYAGKNYRNKSRSEERVKKTCMNCKEKYTVVKSRVNSKFCKMKCRAKFHAKLVTAKQKNQVNVLCNNCHNMISKKASDVRELNFCCTMCMHTYYSKERLFSGANSGTWNGGKKTYYGENWWGQRRLARQRDNYICQKCGTTEEEYGQELSVHHKIPFVLFDNYKEANKLNNLICVCEPCHRKIHSGDNHPSKFKTTYKSSVDDVL